MNRSGRVGSFKRHPKTDTHSLPPPPPPLTYPTPHTTPISSPPSATTTAQLYASTCWPSVLVAPATLRRGGGRKGLRGVGRY